jgi:signal transduction histidine kinase
MGLGLSTALSIFKSHKALIHVESLENKGTTFVINFNKDDPYTGTLSGTAQCVQLQ